MCTVCGCGAAGSAPGGGDSHRHDHRADAGHAHHHGHHHHHHQHEHDGGKGGKAAAPLGAVHAPGVKSSRIIQVEQDILAENGRFAASNRRLFAERQILALNLMSSPGSGKTTLLVRTIRDLQERCPLAVVEGDQETAFDAERIRAAGAPAVQINTGRNCHLDAWMVGKALAQLKPQAGAIVFVENVGNLVCPAAFDLGEAFRVVMLSVTEGDDKPLKYPDMFAAADLMVLMKIDLLPYVEFDVARCIAYARRVRPAIDVVQVSAKTGEGLHAWYDWIAQRQKFNRPAETVEGPRA